ncbi:MAG: hypothetical protein ACI4KA_07560 [Oscillospiraceae bacterium]
MPQLTKRQVITRWIVCAVIGIVLSVVMFAMIGILMPETDSIRLIVNIILFILAPVLIAWECFGISLCFKEWLIKMFTLHWIKGFILYFKSLYWAIKITVKAFSD